jgi:lathosterol oxidase
MKKQASSRKLGFRVTPKQADSLHYVIPLFMMAIGGFSSEPKLWYDSLMRLSTGLIAGMLLLSGIWEYVSKYLAVPVGERLQKGKTVPPMYLREAFGSSLCMFIVATLLSWPVTKWRRGEPTAFKETLEEASWGPYPLAFYILKMFVVLILADAWTFWKHYSLHNPALYAFHKSHHTFHDPSTFAGFAIHPFEGLWTFGPIVLMCFPWVSLYGPLHGPFLGFFTLLNLYLHCGYSIPFLEWLFPKFYINTSVHHNKHHQLSVTHFGEMLTLWDWVLGTHSYGWSEQQVAQQTSKVMVGDSGMDSGDACKDE